MKQVALDEQWILPSETVSFTRDILPILYRAVQYRWLNQRSQRGHGKNMGGDFLKELRLLADKNDPDGVIRRKSIFSRIRNPNLMEPDSSLEEQMANNQASPRFMPPMSGDDGDTRPGSIKTWMKLHRFQYEDLRKWSEGNFISDWNESINIDKFEDASLEELPIEEQPMALDRAPLELCIGAPLFPGIEVTHNLYDKEYYDNKPFRINHKLAPGALTQQMAVPWQADFYFCMDTWWPTARPDEVFVAVDKVQEWSRGVEVIDDDIVDMTNKWSKLGIVVPKDIENETFYMEQEREV
jgi:hypothetical protein